MDIRDKFEVIIQSVFNESMDVRFSEEDECIRYVKEKVEECLEVHNEYQDALLKRFVI